MEEQEYRIFDYWDFILPPIYLLVIFFLAEIVRARNIEKNPIYRFYTWGLFAKILGGITLALIYALHYKGGDTTGYFTDSVSMAELLKKDVKVFFSILFNNLDAENYSFFDQNTGYPMYFRDSKSFSVVRFTTFIVILSGKSFLVSTIVISAIAYIGTWKLFLLFCELFPKLDVKFAWAILFFPSLIFWGSGILKDTYTLAGLSWFTYAFYQAFIKRENVVTNIIIVFLTSALIISIKPYIFVAIMPGSVMWLTTLRIQKIQNWFLKITLAPVIVAVFMLLIYFLFYQTQEGLGQFSSVESVVTKASVTQKDLKMAYYEGNSFDIGEYDNTLGGMLSKAPVAIVAGLFRPFIWEAKNVLMLITGIENLYILAFTLLVIWKLGLYKLLIKIQQDPILFFSFLFSIVFAFSVGVSTSNFGALVRYKIPALPFYLSALMILNENEKIARLKRKNEKVILRDRITHQELPEIN